MLTNEQKAGAWDGLKDAMIYTERSSISSCECKKMAREFLLTMKQIEDKTEMLQRISNEKKEKLIFDCEEKINDMVVNHYKEVFTFKDKKDRAIKKLGEKEISTVCKFMDVDIKEFTKEELIKILSLQQRKWLESIGFKYEE